MLADAFAAIANGFSGIAGGPFVAARLTWPGTPTLDSGGSITAAGTPASVDCMAQVDAATEAHDAAQVPGQEVGCERRDAMQIGCCRNRALGTHDPVDEAERERQPLRVLQHARQPFGRGIDVFVGGLEHPPPGEFHGRFRKAGSDGRRRQLCHAPSLGVGCGSVRVIRRCNRGCGHGVRSAGAVTGRGCGHGREEGRDIAWTYPQPLDDAMRVRDHIAFWNERTDIRVDGVLLPRPVTPWSTPAEQAAADLGRLEFG